MHKFQKDFAAKNSESDKLSHHGYHRIYPWFLAHFRDRSVDLLEIGIHETESLKLWKGYFKQIRLCGIDIDKKKFADADVDLFQVDQSKKVELKKFKQRVEREFDIIIDDGSHVPSHQILTLKELWGLLRPGGVYIIEDIETSYWKKSDLYGYGFNSGTVNVVSFATQFIDEINREFQLGNSVSPTQTSEVANDVEIISFGHNCIILVKKDHSTFAEFYNREYRFKYHINKNSLFRRFGRKVKKLFFQRIEYT